MILEALWDELGAQQPPGAGVVRRRVWETSGSDIFIGVSYPRHERMLILSVSPDAAAGAASLPCTRAIRSTIVEGPDHRTTEIRVILMQPEMNTVFASFADDVLDAVAQASTDVAAVSTLVSRFRHWRWLLAGQNPDGLSEAAAQGLYGELWSLGNMALPSLGSAAVDGWTGPDRDDTDFQFRQVAFEVKTTTAHHPTTVRITSERQLNPVPFDSFYLVSLSLDQVQGGSAESLNDRVELIKAQLAGSDQAMLFADKLLQCGYHAVHSDRYEFPGYVIRELAIFRITPDFPRITEDRLPAGVGRVSYDLDLAACGAWKVSPETLTSDLQPTSARLEH
jgi:hypothetical protein